jgi:hypothetical protein
MMDGHHPDESRNWQCPVLCMADERSDMAISTRLTQRLRLVA